VDAWIGMLAPAGTPDEIVQKLNAAVREILSDPELVEGLAKLGLVPAGMDSETFRQTLVENRADYAKVVAENSITAEE
jgi:tripartite-type tricarboxylate transporter receptor subunit TctC